MYRITIYNLQKKVFKTYEHIHTVKYFSVLQNWDTFTGEEIMTHQFPCLCSYQLIGDNGNYSIDRSIIGSLDIEREL